MDSIKQGANYVSETVQKAASGVSKETNKEVAKDSNASIGTRAPILHLAPFCGHGDTLALMHVLIHECELQRIVNESAQRNVLVGLVFNRSRELTAVDLACCQDNHPDAGLGVLLGKAVADVDGQGTIKEDGQQLETDNALFPTS
ncbi:Glucose-repressible protein Grg1 [Ilyonectria robusta]